ncbi:hypothetical protein GF371_04180 [Candidatus Woesearchaeota archaeon]|nr:hypothetical protein [Candidatus Woesearchaeota archaeon]
MDIESIKGLPLEEQIKELKKLKKRFAKEKGALKEQIFDLEDSRKQKEAFAKNLVASQKEHSAAEVSVIVSSIKDVKGVLTGKNKELQFVEKAIKAAEDLLKKREQELEEEEEAKHEFELLLEQLIILYNKEQEKKPVFLEKILDTNGKRQEKKDEKKNEEDETQLEDELEGVQTRQRRGREEQDYAARQQQGDGDYLPTPGRAGEDEGNAYIPQRHEEKLYEHDDERSLYENKNEDYLPQQRSMENTKEQESERDKLLKKIKQYETGR